MACGPKQIFVLLSIVFLLVTLVEADYQSRDSDFEADDDDDDYQEDSIHERQTI